MMQMQLNAILWSFLHFSFVQCGMWWISSDQILWQALARCGTHLLSWILLWRPSALTMARTQWSSNKKDESHEAPSGHGQSWSFREHQIQGLMWSSSLLFPDHGITRVVNYWAFGVQHPTATAQLGPAMPQVSSPGVVWSAVTFVWNAHWTPHVESFWLKKAIHCDIVAIFVQPTNFPFPPDIHDLGLSQNPLTANFGTS